MRPEQPCYLHLQQEERDSRGAGSASGDARAVDRYLRVRAKHPLASRPELWLGIGGRGPVTPDGIYQIVAKAGKKVGVAVYPHRFRHHFSHTWLDRGGAGGDLMELNGWSSPQMLQWYGGYPGCPGPPPLRPDHEQLTGHPGQPPGALADAGESPRSRLSRRG